MLDRSFWSVQVGMRDKTAGLINYHYCEGQKKPRMLLASNQFQALIISRTDEFRPVGDPASICFSAFLLFECKIVQSKLKHLLLFFVTHANQSKICPIVRFSR